MIFVDTGAFIARYLVRDQYHEQAIKMWEQIGQGRDRLATSNFILDETFTLLSRWAGCSFAADKAKIIYASKKFEIWRPELEDEMKAVSLLEKYADWKISFTDCVSFTLMKKHRVQRVMSFDQHFALAGFESL